MSSPKTYKMRPARSGVPVHIGGNRWLTGEGEYPVTGQAHAAWLRGDIVIDDYDHPSSKKFRGPQSEGAPSRKRPAKKKAAKKAAKRVSRARAPEQTEPSEEAQNETEQ